MSKLFLVSVTKKLDHLSHFFIVLYLERVIPESMERMEIGKFQINQLSLVNGTGRGGGLGSRRLRDSGLPDGSALWGIRGFAVTSGHFVSFRRLCLSGGRFILLGRAALAWLCFLLASGPRFFFFGRAATPGRFRLIAASGGKFLLSAYPRKKAVRFFMPDGF